jgi:DNA-binding response OmpR family regulator
MDTATHPSDIEFVIEQLNQSRIDRAVAAIAAKMIAELARRPPSETHQIYVDLTKNTAQREYATADLSPNNASLLWRLVEGYPRVVSLPELMLAIYGRTKQPSINIVRVMVSALRRDIVKLGADIENCHGQGYRLVLKPMK